MENAILAIMVSVYAIVILVEKEINFIVWSNNGILLYISLVVFYVLYLYIIFRDIDKLDT